MIATDPTVSNPRADGFSLYMNFVGDNILKSIVPKSKVLKSTIHKMFPKIAATGDSQNDNMGNFSKAKYQQVLKARIL
jgi:hypothetical protein